MNLASPPSWPLAVVLCAVVAALVLLAYRRPRAPLTGFQRGILILCRALVLVALLLLIFRPIVLLSPTGSRELVVPVLVDVSRSMRVPDAGGEPRLARATGVLTTTLLPALSQQYKVDLLGVGDTLLPVSIDSLSATARTTDVRGALNLVRDRYRGQHVAGIVMLSDGADTGQRAPDRPGVEAGDSDEANAASGPPVFAVGVGSAGGLRDREVLGIASGEQRLDQASIDLHVSAVSSGFGRTPFSLRLMANGRLVETRQLVPSVEGSPLGVTFTVSPDAARPTIYSADIPVDPAEPVAENNARSVLVSPAGRPRRLLVIEGAPGFDHSFMKRAWSADPGLQVDSVIRKGKNAEGNHTFIIQAAASRTAALSLGFPARREDLYAYDAIAIANVEGDFFTGAQLAMISDFVAERGGGLLVTGGRSFAQRGLVGTVVEAALPVEIDDRRGGLMRAALLGGRSSAGPNALVVTPEGEAHPVMRIGGSVDESRKLWATLPALAAVAPLGGARPGAAVLAVASAPGGEVHPIVAVQRYGQGRSMTFSGEASWRWKMMVPSTNRGYELFWRQAARWLATLSPDPVAIGAPDAPEPGDSVVIEIDARDAAFAAVPDAAVDATIVSPDGDERPLALRRADSGGRFTSVVRPEQPGLYRVHAAARRGSVSLGAADRWIHVGGSDREFADPRLNESFLRRIARVSGGRYVPAADAGQIAGWLQQAARQRAEPERRDLWDQPWIFAVIVLLLSAEWILRRKWGLR